MSAIVTGVVVIMGFAVLTVAVYAYVGLYIHFVLDGDLEFEGD